MTPAHVTVSVTREFEATPIDLFAHWTSPATRVRWEAGPETGMRYDGFDTRSGGEEIVRIFEGRTEIGHMVQTIRHFAPGDLLVSVIKGYFGGELTMLLLVSVQFERSPTGTRLRATSQIMDLKGRDQTERHTRGWEWLLDRFAADIAEHGLVKA